ncbi:MAG: VOC family protein [Candidatus Marinimicrobia bacterium]|nr:VOC family protein [Candidatus Neomarinimicrobiota bacterium]
MKGTVHHIEIYVSDLGRTTEFWSWFLSELGYDIYQKWKEGISYKLFDTYLVFVQTEEKYRDMGYHRKRTGLNHIAFHAESRTMVDDITQKLKEKNIKLLYDDKYPFAGGKDYYALFFEDPDRIKVELVAPNED